MQGEDKLLADKQLELVCQRYPFLFASSLLASGGLAATLWQVVEHQSWLVWQFALLWSVMAIQFFYSRRYLSSRDVSDNGFMRWRYSLAAGAALDGACWGFAIFAVASSPLEMSVFLLMFVLAGVAAFASVTLAAAPFAAEAFLLPAILPGTLWMLFYGEKLVLFMGAISLAYLGLMLLFSRRTHQMLRSLILTAEKNSQLLAAQRESDRRNAELFAHIEDCIVFTDVGDDGSLTIASINPAMERLCGTSGAAVRGKRKSDFFPAALGERLEAYDRECIASGKPLYCDEVVEHPSGKRYFSLTRIPMRDESGRVSRVAVIARDITERKQTEEVLAVREREFRTLVENAPDPIFRYDRDCRRIYVNKAVEWISGIAASDMLGKTPAEASWVGSDEKAKVLQSIRRVLETGRQEEVTVQFAARDGGMLHFQHLHVPEFAADGSVESVLSIGRDITSRKYMEEVLLKSEREYRALSENSPDNIARYDRDCRLRYLNKNFNAELGIPAGYLMGKTLAEVFSDGRFDEYEEILKRVIESGKETDHFLTLRDRGEGERDLHFRFVPERDKCGEVSGVLAIGRDLTGLKRIEQELATREREFRSLAENMPENMVRFDTLGRYLYVNPTHERLLGVSLSELAGTSIPDSHAQVKAAIAQVVATGLPMQIEQNVPVGDNIEIHNVSLAPEFDADGRLVSVLAIGRDMTGIYRMQEALSAREREFRMLAENLPVAVIRYDSECRRRYLNPAAERVLRGNADELLGHVPGGSTVPASPAMIAHYRDRRDEVLAGGGACEFEFVLDALPAGQQEFYEVRLAPQYGEDGKVCGVLALCYDITERKKSMCLLEETRAHLLTVMRAIPDMVWLKDADGVYLSCNHAFERFFGAEESAIIGKTDYDFVDAELADFFRLKDREAIDAGQVCINEEWITYAEDGRRGLLETRKVPVLDRDGKVTGVLGVARDITERRRMEAETKQREREFHALAENLPDPVFRYGRDCRRVYVNPAACRVTATPAEQLLGNLTVDCDTVESASAARATASIREVFATGERRSIYVEYIVDGKTSEYQGVLVPEFDADGQVATVLAIAHEVTDLREAERRAANFFANMPGFAYTFRLSPEGHMSFPFASWGIEEIFGLYPEEVKNDAAPLFALVQADDLLRVKAAMEVSVRTLQPFQIEARMQRPGQPERWIECRSMPERQADGAVLWHGVMLDITERKRIEGELQRTTGFQKLLLDSLREVGMWQLVVEGGKIIYHNDSHIGGLLGYAGSDFDAAPHFIDVIHPDDRPRIAEIYRKRLAGEAVPDSYEIGLLAKDGSRREYQLYVSLIPDSNPPQTMTLAVDITERKRMEAVLAESMQEFRSLAESSPDFIIRYDREGRIRYLNNVLLNLLGISHALEFIGKRPSEAWPDGRFDAIERAAARVVKLGVVSSLEICVPAGAGEPHIHHLLVAPERDASGRIIGTIVFGRDITAIKRMEEALAAREREFRSLAEHLPDNIVRWDSQGRYAYVNPTTERTIGARSEEVCGKRPSEAFPDGRYSPLETAIDRILATGEAIPCVQQTVPLENGEVRFHEISLAPERDAAGRVIGVLGVGRDMTDIHRMQEAIAAREQEFRSLAESSPDNIIRYDRDGRICYLNSSLIAQFGLNCADEVVGRLSSEIWTDGRYDAIEQAALRVLESGIAESLELFEPLEPGNEQYHHLVIAPERDAGGQIIGTIAFGRNITAVKKNELLLEERYARIVELNLYLEETSRSLEEQTTELEASQEQLKSTLEFTEGIINAIPDILFEVNREARYLNVWTQKPELLAAEKAHLLGKTAHDVLSPEAAETIMEGLREAMEQGLSFGKIIRIDLPQGEHWFELSFSKKPGDAPSDTRFLVLSRDVTERKRMELALQEGEARYRHNYHLLQSVLESASDVSVFALDRNYCYISFNAKHRDNTKRLRGADVVLGKSMLDTIDREEFREFCRQGFDHVLAGNNLAVESREVLVQDGITTYEYYENHGSPIRNDAGEVVGLTVFTHNITARKQMESEQANSRNFLNKVIDSISDPVFVKDGKHCWVLMNDACCALIGQPREVLLGKSDYDFLPKEQADVFWEKDELVFKSGEVNVNEEAITAADGNLRYIQTMKSPFTSADGQGFLVAVLRDITGRKQMEVAREGALAEAQRLAQLRSAFMAQMSHELRTPLNGILGYTQNLLEDESLGEKQSARLQIIQHSGEHLLTLINGILDHAAIEADKFELVSDDIELHAFLSAIIGIIRVRIEQKNLAFICDADEGLPAVVRGDAQRLRQILLNLLANAVKFTDRGQVTLRVGYTAPQRIRFAVQDSGIGIAPEQLETIFLPFEQVAESKRRAGGNGLGLAISRKLVRLMGGDIKVESQPGAGSTFSFEIDMAAGQSDAAKVDAAALSEQAGTNVAQATSLLLAPPRDELDILYGHALRGSMREIVRHADRLADSDERYQPFAKQVRQLAGSFQTKALVALIEEYRAKQA